MPEQVYPILTAGAVVVAAAAARRLCLRCGIQPLVGFIAIGMSLGVVHELDGVVVRDLEHYIRFLGQLGIVILLFKVGLESNITGLLAQMRRALEIWAGNVAVPALAGFAVVFYGFELGLIPALFAGVALSATSIGVATAIWQQAGKLKGDYGSLVVDVAELDDLSAILMMAVLFTVAPLLANGDQNGLAGTALASLSMMLVKLSLLVAGCYVFARFLEKRFTAWFIQLGSPPVSAAVATAGMACVIAGFAEWLGFSVAVGALLAGLAFSRDPAEFEIDTQLTPIYEFLSPFFFIAIGFSFQFTGLGETLLLGAILLLVAMAAKLIGAGLPAAALLGRRPGLAIGVSMIPRAEVAMIVLLHGLRMGPEYVPQKLLDAMNVVVIATVMLVPLILPPLLRRLPD